MTDMRGMQDGLISMGDCCQGDTEKQMNTKNKLETWQKEGHKDTSDVSTREHFYLNVELFNISTVRQT